MVRGVSSVRYRFGAERRARRWAWLAVAAIIGLSSGLALSLVAGARRTDTAVNRFIAGAAAQETVVVSGIPGTFDFAELDLDEIGTLAGVTDHAQVVVLAAAGHTDSGVLVDSTTVNFIVDPSGRVGEGFTHFRYVDGRPPDPSDPNEVVAVFRSAEAFDLDVGSTIDTHFVTAEEQERLFLPPDEGGTTFEEFADQDPIEQLRVVGIVVEAGGIAPPADDDTTNIWMSPAAAERYADAAVIDVDYVQLRDGAEGEAAFLDGLEALGGGRPVLYISTAEDARAADRGVTPTVRALLLAAALLAVVTVLVAAQVLSRQASSESGDDPVLRALGWTRQELLRLRLAKALAVGVGAAVIAGVVAIALSPLYPIGLARMVEPDRGVDVDGAVLVLGGLVVLFAVFGLAALTGWWDLRRRRAVGARRPGPVLTALTATGAPPPVVVGTSLALQGGVRSSVPPVVSAGTSMVLGLATVIGVLGFMASLGHLTSNPPLYGWNWDIELGQEFSPELSTEDVEALRTDPDVAALATGAAVTVDVGGERVNAYAVDDVLGTIEPSLLAGRRAEDVGEAVVAPGVGAIGDLVTVRFAGESSELEIVGHAALPRAEAMFTFETLQRLAPESARQTALIELREGADVDEVVERLTGPPVFALEQDLALPHLPDDLVNFGRVDAAPAVVAGSMAVVAAATLIHTLVTTVRRRRRDLAILRTLGFTRRQVLSTVASQSLVLVLVAVVLAVPIGVAVGRTTWQLFADELQVVARPIVPILTVLLATVGTIALAVTVALGAGRWTSRRSAALVLRAE